MILTITLNPSIDRRYIVDGFQKGKVFRAKEVQYTLGGKGLNVTKVIKSFNESVMATGFLGGRSGIYIVELLDKMGIEHQFIPINGETRSCIAILSDDGIQTEVLERGPSISSEEVLNFYQLYREIIKDSDIICGSGSLPQGLPSDIYRDLIFMAKEQNKKFILDTSGEALKYAIEASPFLVKPNKFELEELTGFTISSEADVVRSARYIIENDVKIVVVSLGKDGAMVFYDKYYYRVKVPKVELVNSAGSGDSMVAGIVVSLIRDYDFEYLLKIAAACGTANAMELESGKVDMHNMKKVMKEIEIEKKEMY